MRRYSRYPCPMANRRVYRASNDRCDASFSDSGAQFLEWTPAGTEPVLWLSERSLPWASTPARGGVPICAPWFGVATASLAAPGSEAQNHGFLRNATWELVERTDDSAILSFTYAPATKTEMAKFPHRFTAQLHASFGEHLHLALTMTNADEEAFYVDEALHPYFNVSDVREISVVGLDGAEQLCTVTNEHSVQEGDVTFTQGRVDSIFDFTGTVSIVDPGFARRIVIEKENSASTIVWNPAEAKAADMHHEDWKHFVCVEVGNVRQNAVFLQPGQSHTISLTITVEKLN
mgnify:FL=1